MSNQQKINIRRKVRAELNLLTDEQKKSQSADVFLQLENYTEFRNAKTILLFWSLPDEVCSHDFIEKWHTEKQILLPVVVDNDLILRKYNGICSIAKGAFNILEPIGDDFTDFEDIDLAIIPGVAFTAKGARTGRGKGFYDRFLPKISATKIGICFAEQIVDDIPCEVWDVKMDKVIFPNKNKRNKMKKAIVVGATSGIGKEVAKELLRKGWKIGIAGRRLQLLEEFQRENSNVEIQQIDITTDEATANLQQLIDKLGGMDLYFNASGIGFQNVDLKIETEVKTAQTNVVGFTKMVDFAFNYFKNNGGGHIAVISSIAGTKGLGVAPAYSATKRYQNIYIDSLEQLAYLQKLNISFTDIRPGFVDTNLLNDGEKYPMLMQPTDVAKSIVRAIEKKKRRKVIDTRYAIMTFFWKLIPNWIWKRLPIVTHQKC